MDTAKTMLATLLLASGIAHAESPMLGAFGVEFGTSVDGELLAGRETGATLAPLPAALADYNVVWDEDLAPRWQRLVPAVIPKLLLDQPVTPIFSAILNENDRPVRLIARAPAVAACGAWRDRIVSVLKDRYGEPILDSTQALVFTAGTNYAQVRCEQNRLWLEYIDGDALAAWHDAVVRERNLRLARDITERSGEQLVGAFGFSFERKVGLPGLMPDVAAIVTPPHPYPLWANGSYRLMVDPNGYPLRIEGTVELPAKHAAVLAKNALVDALAELYGEPTRDAPSQSIINNNGRYAIVRRVDTKVSLVLVDAAALERLRIRVAERSKQAEGQRRRQLAAEQQGF